MMLPALLTFALSAAITAATDESAPDLPEFFEKDFQAEQDTRQLFEPDEFVFKFEEAEAETPGGNLRPSLVSTNTFLGVLPGDGNGQNLVTLEACGVNQPHHHPRGTETSFIVKGELLFGLVEENGGRVVETNLTQGTAISIPQGLMHFAQNLGCEQAQFLANFPNRDPGTQTTIENFLRLSESVIRGTLQVDDDVIAALREGDASMGNPSVDPVCAKRCGLDGKGDRKGKRDDDDRD